MEAKVFDATNSPANIPAGEPAKCAIAPSGPGSPPPKAPLPSRPSEADQVRSLDWTAARPRTMRLSSRNTST